MDISIWHFGAASLAVFMLIQEVTKVVHGTFFIKQQNQMCFQRLRILYLAMKFPDFPSSEVTLNKRNFNQFKDWKATQMVSKRGSQHRNFSITMSVGTYQTKFPSCCSRIYPGSCQRKTLRQSFITCWKISPIRERIKWFFYFMLLF